ncbi:MAG: response regulator [Candidatus Acidiferrales bacterium]
MAFKPRILVVDKDPETLKLLETTIKTMGGEPFCHASGRAALTVANRQKFDGAFIDWDSAELGGEQVIKMIRRSKSNSTIPIAILTTTHNAKVITSGFKAGATFFLSKPGGTLELTRLLNASRGAMLEERRRYTRVPVKMAVVCKWGGKTATGQAVDVSASGLLVSLIPPPEPGSKLAVEFTLPKAHNAIEVDAEVMRVTHANQTGLRFLQLAPEKRDEILKYVSKSEAATEASS